MTDVENLGAPAVAAERERCAALVEAQIEGARKRIVDLRYTRRVVAPQEFEALYAEEERLKQLAAAIRRGEG